VLRSQIFFIFLGRVCHFLNLESSRLVPGTLSVAKFHGPDRARSARQLVAEDVVLTTYATLVEDSKRAKLLQKIIWFRIILDEGKSLQGVLTEYCGFR
jgi:SNF2 family DNA or RNA helicase